MKALKYNKKELAVLKNNYFMAKALYETTKEIAEEIQRVILANHIFYESEEMTDGEKPKRILKPSESWYMTEEDFQKFLDLCYEEYKKAGIEDKRGKEYCPEAEEHDLYLEAERQLVLYGIDIIPDEVAEKEILREAVKIVKYKKKVLVLILRLEC